jgi:hypothetical protein
MTALNRSQFFVPPPNVGRNQCGGWRQRGYRWQWYMSTIGHRMAPIYHCGWWVNTDSPSLGAEIPPPVVGTGHLARMYHCWR